MIALKALDQYGRSWFFQDTGKIVNILAFQTLHILKKLKQTMNHLINGFLITSHNGKWVIITTIEVIWWQKN